MQPLLDALTVITGGNIVEVFRYPVSPNGLRLVEGSESAGTAHIVWGKDDKEEMSFGFSILPTEMDIVPTAILRDLGIAFEYRWISFEQIIELGVQPWEIVERLRRVASGVEFQAEAAKATQKMAQA